MPRAAAADRSCAELARPRISSTVCAGVLPKSGPGSSISCSNVTPRPQRQLDPLGEKHLDIREHPSIQRGIEQLLLRRGAGVHEHERGAGLRADVGEPRIAQAADVIDDRRAGGDRRRGDRRLVGVDRDDDAKLIAHPSDERDDPLDLLLGRHRGPIRHAGLAADVDDLGAGGDERVGERDALLERLGQAGIRERIRRRVDNPHQQRAQTEVKRGRAGPQRQSRRVHGQAR